MADKRELSGPQRAAVLLMYLSEGAVKQLLAHLSTDELREIGLAMAEVENIETETIEEVVAEFVRDLTTTSMVPTTGKEFALGVLPKLIDEPRRARVFGSLKRAISTDFAEYIAARPPRTVATMLADEHPQTQAVALLLMGPDNAAKILEALDEQQRFEVTWRMTRIEQVPGDLADDVEASIREALEDQGSDRWKIPGSDVAAAVLGRLGREIQDDVLDRIGKQDYDLSNTLRRRMVSFVDLVALDRRAMQTLLMNVERSSLMRALRGLDPQQRHAFTSNMSSRAAADLIEEMEIMGALPRSDVEAAREEIVQVALRLQDEGVIRVHRSGADEMM